MTFDARKTTMKILDLLSAAKKVRVALMCGNRGVRERIETQQKSGQLNQLDKLKATNL